MQLGKTFVKPEGPEDAPYVLVGEQPGQKEIRYGRPFIGPAGRVADECLHKVGIPRSDCRIMNVQMDFDQHYSTNFKFMKNDVVVNKRGMEHLSLLKEELLKTRGIIVAMGGLALWALTKRRGIYNWRGSVVGAELIPDRLVIPCLHTATVIPPKNVYTNKLLIQYDLKKAKEFVDEKRIVIERKYIIKPSFLNSISYLTLCIEKGYEGYTIDYDIETSGKTIINKELLCISFAYKKEEAICIPFNYKQGDYFSIEQEAAVMKLIAKLLEEPRIKKRGQNIIFDSHFLLRKYGIKGINFDDTMIAQQIIMPDYNKGLDFITSIWTDLPYYKADGKFWLQGTGSWEQGWNYNCIDSIVCADAFPKQYAALEKQGNKDTYERKRAIIPILAYMMERGVKIDVEAMSKAYDEELPKIEEMKEELNKICGQELNANSPTQVANYFYIQKGLKAYKKRKKITTDEEAMKRVARKGFPEAHQILEIRRAIKNRSTYLNPEKVDKDGRMRCSYNPVGTRFSRLSSSKNIFGTGNNLQNQPHHILRYFIADKGYIYYSFDLAQAENRIVAYVGRVEQMIEAFEGGIDVHSLTASLILQKPVEEISNKEQSSSLGGGRYSERFWGKKANHGLNYDLGYKSFALKYEIPENEGKFIVERYHMAYPGVRHGFHVYVKDMLSRNRTVTNLMGRNTVFLDRWGDSLFKDSFACIPQGTVGDLVDERGLGYIYYNQDLFAPVEILMQVHDSIGFQIPLSTPWKEHAKMLLWIKESLETPLEVHGREFIIPVDLTMGFNMYKEDCIEIGHKDFPVTPEMLAKRLEENYDGLTL